MEKSRGRAGWEGSKTEVRRQVLEIAPERVEEEKRRKGDCHMRFPGTLRCFKHL